MCQISAEVGARDTDTFNPPITGGWKQHTHYQFKLFTVPRIDRIPFCVFLFQYLFSMWNVIHAMEDASGELWHVECIIHRGRWTALQYIMHCAECEYIHMIGGICIVMWRLQVRYSCSATKLSVETCVVAHYWLQLCCLTFNMRST